MQEIWILPFRTVTFGKYRAVIIFERYAKDSVGPVGGIVIHGQVTEKASY